MRIKELRQQKKLTQLALAKELQLSKNQILRFENEQTPVPSDILIKLSEYFEVSLDYLCGRPFNNKIGYVPKDKLEVVTQLLKLDGGDIERAMAYITALVEAKHK